MAEYVKQLTNNTCGSSGFTYPCLTGSTLYCSAGVACSINSYPSTYVDNKGGQSVACNYTGVGSKVMMDHIFLAGLVGCATAFRTYYHVPIFCDQIGIRTATPNAINWESDQLATFAANNIGWVHWLWRLNYSASNIQGGDQGVVWVDSSTNSHTKYDWYDMLQFYMPHAPGRLR